MSATDTSDRSWRPEVTMMRHLLHGEYMAFASASEAVGGDATGSATGIHAIFSAAVGRALAPGTAMAVELDELTDRIADALGPDADVDARLAEALIAHAVDPAVPVSAAHDSLALLRTKVLLTYGIAKHFGLRGADADALLRADGADVLLRARPSSG